MLKGNMKCYEIFLSLFFHSFELRLIHNIAAIYSQGHADYCGNVVTRRIAAVQEGRSPSLALG